jgi:quercetin dioxygenase-like cupin family protein
MKEETLIVERGLVAFKIGEKEFAAGEGVSVHLMPGTYHKFGGLTDAALVEVSTADSKEDNERDPKELSGPMTAKGVSIRMDDGTELKLYHERLAGTL